MDYNRFDDIKHRPLQTYNRVIMARNILEDFGEGPAKNYLLSFTKEERREMLMMQSYIELYGRKAAVASATDGLVVKYDVGSRHVS